MDDMRAFKSRGKQHVHDKSRYKNKKHKPQSASDQKTAPTVPKLPSNSDRYKSLDLDDEDCDASTNFSMLASAPVSVGGHFQFKSDKNLVCEPAGDITHELCQLNLGLLEHSINSVPFYVRCSLDEAYLDDRLKAKMDEDAEYQERVYRKYLETVSATTDQLPQGDVKEKCNEDVTVEKFSSLNVKGSSDPVCSSDLQHKDVKKDKNNTPETTPPSNDPEDLEDWLDGVLDT